MNNPLLARYAECIFWLARLVERAESLARILEVNETYGRDRSGVQDWRIDRGVITAVSGSNFTLREKDGTVVTLSIDPTARVQGPARFSSVGQLRKRLRIVVYRLADQSATTVQVEGVGP